MRFSRLRGVGKGQSRLRSNDWDGLHLAWSPRYFVGLRLVLLRRSHMAGGSALDLFCCIGGRSDVRLLAGDRTFTICDSDHGPTAFMLFDLYLELADMAANRPR